MAIMYPVKMQTHPWAVRFEYQDSSYKHTVRVNTHERMSLVQSAVFLKKCWFPVCRQWNPISVMCRT